MQFTNPIFVLDPLSGKRSCIQTEIDGSVTFVPLDPNNRHYKELMRQVAEEGLTIADPE